MNLEKLTSEVRDLAIKTGHFLREECENFFNDICTMQELEALAQRFDVACKLTSGKVYSEISADTGASPATVSRVNRCIKYGNGGYKTVIDRLGDKAND